VRALALGPARVQREHICSRTPGCPALAPHAAQTLAVLWRSAITAINLAWICSSPIN
jgi:hypothetical protein